MSCYRCSEKNRHETRDFCFLKHKICLQERLFLKEYYNCFETIVSRKIGRKGMLQLLSVWVSLDGPFGTFFCLFRLSVF